MRVGIVALLHESNTFVPKPTTVELFETWTWQTSSAMRTAWQDAHHEVGGFFAGLDDAQIEAVPVFAARALPSGTITADAFDFLLDEIESSLSQAGELDGLLVAPHGATVSERFPDADGHWLAKVRQQLGPEIPIIGTIDAHANLSRQMVDSVDALIAYRSNPHLDQRDRGIEAAKMMVRTLRGEIRPTMSATFPPLAINIERQMTSEDHFRPHYEFANAQLSRPEVLSNSIVLGFPYADVDEMGSATIAITNDNPELATQTANELAMRLWEHRDDFRGRLLSVDAALEQCDSIPGPVCLLDMGDNVGGGSAADGTTLLHALHQRNRGRAFVCLYDPKAVEACRQIETGTRVELSLGGHVDDQHGEPFHTTVTVESLHDGKFQESKPRHGGIMKFDQGPTAVVTTDSGVTIMLTSRRMVPFSLEQVRSGQLDPAAFDILVAKGVNAPLAAYSEVCPSFLRVNTPGSTCADMTQLRFQNRRRPMFPFEQNTTWAPTV
ncbi:M81 family metallopeptidase [Thalassoroseus pseudoceratinae]|uniref:M81 family metallopeptidase n=1 Tax=Thalassoroseus pseudoceratinae TaxID=2713176 RepID=UPI001421485A|nr:M81 family metallopeptidase [Thalassoroseus pseudoceratinae]